MNTQVYIYIFPFANVFYFDLYAFNLLISSKFMLPYLPLVPNTQKLYRYLPSNFPSFVWSGVLMIFSNKLSFFIEIFFK